MALKQTVVWTALPNGIREEAGQKFLQIAVFISPRLQSDEPVPSQKKLSQYKDWRNWHQKIATATFTVRIGGTTLSGNDVVRTGEPVDPQVWQAVFNDNTTVMPYKPEDFTKKRLHSYPVMNLHNFVRDRYQDIAVNPDAVENLPGMRDLFKGLGDVYISRMPGQSNIRTDNIKQNNSGPRDYNPFENLNPELLQRYSTAMSKGAIPPGAPDTPLDFLRLSLFHRPHSEIKYDGMAQQYLAKKVAIAVPKPDFHEAVSSLGDYPKMLPKFGLVVNLEVKLTGNISSSANVQVVPTWASTMPTVNFSPLTAYEISGNAFRTRPRPSNPETADGLLKIGAGGGFDVIQLDVDGAGLKLLNLVYSLVSKATRQAPDTAEKEGLASLRSAGLSLVKTGRAFLTSRVFDRMALHNTAVLNLEKNAPGTKETTLYTEDVTRGYRVDIHDNVSGKWHSLCFRRGMYKFGAGGSVHFDNVIDEGFVQPGATEAADDSKPDDMWMQETLFKWEGWSLAVPRPAKAIVQTDPGSPDPPQRVENTVATEFKIQADYFPVANTLPRLRFNREYKMRARVVDLAGNSVALENAPDSSPHISSAERYRRFEPVMYPVVILRALPIEGEAPERLVIRTPNATDDAAAPSPATSERHIAPPKSSQLTAELHGLFDDSETGKMKADATTYNLIKSLDGGKFKEADIPVSPTEKAKSAMEPVETLKLPYMPDPLALTAACSFYDLPGKKTNEPVHLPQISFGGSIADWPSYKPFRIRLEEGNAAPSFSAGVLTVPLPKSYMVTMRIRSSFTSIEHLGTMGLWRWTEQRGSAALDSLRTLSTSGRNSLLTPFRTLTFIHAVQRPLLDPVLAVKPGKDLGDTFATLDGKADTHIKSTGHIDVYAEWNDPIDDVTKKEPDDKPGPKFEAFVFDMKLELPPNPSAVSEPMGRPFVGLPGDEKPTKMQKRRQEFRDTKYHEVTYYAIGTTRFREFFPKSTTEFTRKGPGTTVDVLNSARPDAPRVLYAVPTFGWKKIKENGVDLSARRGNGLRIYLDRPWYSSGKGEQLGVVLRDGSGQEASDNLKLLGSMFSAGEPELVQQYLTSWGMDPIWLNKPLPADVPRTEHFPDAVGPRGGLTLDEMVPEFKVAVAPHNVAFDAERGLWYCDISVQPGETYFPFIRLALARYQPKSVDNAHLSRVVRAEFMQLTPDRLASISSHATKSNVRVVAVAGYVHHGSLAGHVANEVEVSVERHASAGEDALTWRPVPDSAVRLDRIDATTPGVWTGEVTLPTDTGRYRLVIKEYELFLADDFDAAVYKANNSVYNQFKQERRLVYADVIEVG